MLKNNNRPQNPEDNSAMEKTHFTSYNDYRKKTGKRTHKDLSVFISVLVIGILIFLGFAKILSPNVDVGIADNDDEEVSQFDDENENSSSVDERLQNLQDEDGGKSSDDSMFSPELDEKVVLPRQKRKTVGEMEAEMQNAQLQQNKADAPDSTLVKQNKTNPKPQGTVKKTPAPAAPVNVRVVVGSYATEKQAEVAKSIMQDAGLGIVPVVKNINGTYTLQVGSYSSVEKAQQSVNNLLRSNFPARIIE